MFIDRSRYKEVSLAIIPAATATAIHEQPVFAAPPVLDSMFSSGAVLRMGQPGATVWGYAEAGRAVSVTIGGRPAASSITRSDGSWEATLPPQPARFNVTLAVQYSDTVLITEPHYHGSTSSSTVSFGVVLMCSGTWLVPRAASERSN